MHDEIERLVEELGLRSVAIVRAEAGAEWDSIAPPKDAAVAIFALMPDKHDDIVALRKILVPVHSRAEWSWVLLGTPVTFDMILNAAPNIFARRQYWQTIFGAASPWVKPIDPEAAPDLWRAVIGANPDIKEELRSVLTSTPAGPPLQAVLEDPRWKPHPYIKFCIVDAAAIALAHVRPVDEVILLGVVLHGTDFIEPRDAAFHALETLVEQARHDPTKLQNFDKTLGFLTRPNRLLGDAEAPTDDEVIARTSAKDAAVLLSIIQEAEAVRARTSSESVIHTRHFLAALLARSAVAEYLDQHGFDVDSLRRGLLKFIVERHGENADAWRAALFASAPFLLTNRVASDVWTYHDSLGHNVYAHAIADSILRGTTEPPLTISIQAPWGQGKTSFMKKMQHRLDPDARKRDEELPETQQLAGAVASTYRELLRWIGQPDRLLRMKAWFGRSAKTGAPPPSADAGLIEQKEKQIPTVWFNPLYYSSRDQIWAGLAHAILHQLAQQTPSQRIREEFWLRLQFARINVETLRRDVQRFVVLRLLPRALMWGGAVVGLTLLFLALPPAL